MKQNLSMKQYGANRKKLNA